MRISQDDIENGDKIDVINVKDTIDDNLGTWHLLNSLFKFNPKGKLQLRPLNPMILSWKN